MPAASEGLPAVVRRQPPVNGCHRGLAGSGLRDRGTENCRPRIAIFAGLAVGGGCAPWGELRRTRLVTLLSEALQPLIDQASGRFAATDAECDGRGDSDSTTGEAEGDEDHLVGYANLQQRHGTGQNQN